MCSIFGYYKLNGKAVVNTTFVAKATKIMHHRGPDAQGFKEFNNKVGLGNQRLSIIDTRDIANQPLIDEKSAIVFNGEIYNYLELKSKFLGNTTFKSLSDTEVLQKGLEKYGVKFLNNTNGMFAFAYLDKKTNALILGRDRFGVKPLHYFTEGSVLYFASEITPLIKIKKELKKNSIVYNSFENDTATDFDENTFVKDIFQVQKGHYLLCRNENIIEKKWYFGKDFQFDPKIYNDKNKALNYFENLLTDAISLRLRSDVPVCLTLSSGVDSSLIYTLIREHLKVRPTLFTFTNSGSKINELDLVKKLTSEYKDNLEVIKINKTITPDNVRQSLRFLEFPIWDASGLAYMSIYKAIHHKHFKVVIEGHGSDELLGGYPYLLESAIAEYILKSNFIKAYILTQGLVDTEVSESSVFRRFLYIIKKTYLDKGFIKNFNKAINYAFDYKILPIVLRTFDRLTMSASVESRSPFMDYRVVEFLKDLPLKYKFSEIGNKAILREILKKYKKEYIYKNKKKIGFGLDIKKYNISGFSNWKKDSIDYINKYYKLNE